jgi:hypothetical protein
MPVVWQTGGRITVIYTPVNESGLLQFPGLRHNLQEKAQIAFRNPSEITTFGKANKNKTTVKAFCQKQRRRGFPHK